MLGVGWSVYQDTCSDYSRMIYRTMLNPWVPHSVRDQYALNKLRQAGFRNVINTGCLATWAPTPEFCREIPTQKARHAVTTITDYRRDPERDNEILAILRYVTDSGITTLANVFPTTNTVRYNAVGLLISGVLSITATLLVVKFTDWDVYVIAGTSSAVTIIRSLVFLIPVTSRFLGLKWYTFYPQVGQSMLSCAVIIGYEHKPNSRRGAMPF